MSVVRTGWQGDRLLPHGYRTFSLVAIEIG